LTYGSIFAIIRLYMSLSPERQVLKHLLVGVLPLEKRYEIYKIDAIARASIIMDVFNIPERLGFVQDQNRQQLFQLHFAGYYLRKGTSEPTSNLRALQAEHPSFSTPIADGLMQTAGRTNEEMDRVGQNLHEEASCIADKIREKALLDAKSFIGETGDPQDIFVWERNKNSILAAMIEARYQAMLAEGRTPEEIQNAANLISSKYWQKNLLPFREWRVEMNRTIDYLTN
jgi:hypothetical protein